MFFILMLMHCVGPKIRFITLVTKELQSILKTVDPHVSFTFIPCSVLGLTFIAIEQLGILMLKVQEFLQLSQHYHL